MYKSVCQVHAGYGKSLDTVSSAGYNGSQMPTKRGGTINSDASPSHHQENQPLTPRQTEVLKAVERHIEENGFPPSQRELAAGLGISASRAIEKHLAVLERKGYLRRGKGARALSLPDTPGQSVPILGRVGAGSGILAQETIEGHVRFKDFLLGTDFLLRVKGDSMIDEGIMEGDLVQVRRQPLAEDGDIVVALVGEEGVVKRLRRTGRGYQLESANPKYSPITLDFQLIGKVVGLVRKY